MVIDILGIAIAFITVILLFSILITSITELVQRTFQLRNRNLRKGMKLLLEKLGFPSEVYDDSIADLITSPIAKSYASLTQPIEIEKEDVKKILENPNINKEKPAFDPDLFDFQYRRIESFMSLNFKNTMAKWTFAVSFVIVVVFQLSTFDLLKNISSDEKLRKELIAYASNELNNVDTLNVTREFPVIADKVIQNFSKTHPELSEPLKSFTGMGSDNKELLLYEFSMILKEHEITTKNYRNQLATLVDEELEMDRLATEKKTKETLATLSRFQFNVLPQGATYYYQKSMLKNWVGMLITMLLLSLGAPFWFNILNKLMVIKNTFKPKK